MTSLEGESYQKLAIISAICFVVSLATFVYSKQQKFYERWYQARALAESVKTVSWRFIMLAEPYKQNDENENLKKFLNLLKELLEENRGICKHLGEYLPEQGQVTSEMDKILKMSFEEKKQIYLDLRINNQMKWYVEKME